MLTYLLALAHAASVSYAFVITNLTIQQAQLDQLNNPSVDQATKDALGSDMVGNALRSWVQVPSNMILVSAAEAGTYHGTFPNSVIDGSCEHKITAKDNSYDFNILHDSYLNGSVTFDFKGKTLAVFAEAYLDNGLNLLTSVQVEVGVSAFGKCQRVLSDTNKISVQSTGQSIMAAKLSASDVHIGKTVDGTLALIFKLGLTLEAAILSWNVNQVSASGGCKIEIGGITIVSVCGWLADQLAKKLEPIIEKIAEVQVPALMARIQDKINAKLNDEIVIPLKL